MQLLQISPLPESMLQLRDQLHRFQRKRFRPRHFASRGQIPHLQDNRETLRNRQIYDILPDDHLSCKECLGLSPKSSRVESERDSLNREVVRELVITLKIKHEGYRSQEIKTLITNPQHLITLD